MNRESGAGIKFLFTDAGAPGANDWAEIVIRDSSGQMVLNTPGYLEKRNHQAHRKLGR